MISWANGGHPPPLLRTLDKAAGLCREEAGGTGLGCLPEEGEGGVQGRKREEQGLLVCERPALEVAGRREELDRLFASVFEHRPLFDIAERGEESEPLKDEPIEGLGLTAKQLDAANVQDGSPTRSSIPG